MSAVWNKVENDFGGDETGNFGPRLETGIALYQVDTTATIGADGLVTSNPRVKSCSSEEQVFIAAGCCVSIFQESGHKFLSTLTLEHTVDALACDDDAGNLLVIGDAGGKLHFIDIPTQTILFSKVLLNSDEIVAEQEFQSISFFTTNQGVTQLFVATASGKLFHFVNIQLDELSKALENGDNDYFTTMQSEMVVEILDTSIVHTEVTTGVFAVPHMGKQCLLTSGRGEHLVSVWDKTPTGYSLLHTLPSILANGVGVTKCELCPNSSHIFVLDDNKILSLWNLASFTLLKQWDSMKIQDFMLLDTGKISHNSLQSLKILTLTNSSDGYNTLSICELPKMKETYNIKLELYTRIIHGLSSQETIFFVEGIQDTEVGGRSTFINTIRLRCLTEADPETRFQRLLNKKQFEEAEKFAKIFTTLDIELVYNVKASHIINQLSPWCVDDLSESEIENAISELQLCLEQFKDNNHLVNCCVKAYLPSFSANLALLNYARTKLNDSINSAGADEKLKLGGLLTWVLETLHRLATYQVAFGIENFTGAKWEHFHNADILQEFLLYLSKGDTNVSFTIWRRHQSEFEEVFSDEVVESILEVIPEMVTSDELSPWLAEDFIPYVIRIFPPALPKLAKWLEQRARNMELLEKIGWPQNSLRLCELLHNTCLSVSKSSSVRGMATANEFATQMCNLSFGYATDNQEQVSQNAFLRLQTLIVQLRDLVSLHTKYNCKLTLAEYVKETTESLTYRMLDRVVAVELIPSTLEKIVRPYMKEHNLNEEKLLFQYIGDLTARYRMTYCAGEGPWEAKAIAVISCITEPEYKCRAIFDAMQRAYIPWTLDMKKLVQEGLALDHPCVSELQQQVLLMEMKQMLTNYDLRNLDVTEESSADTLLYHILSQDRPTAVEDAKAVVNTYNSVTEQDLYLFRLKFLIQNDRLDEAMKLLAKLDDSVTMTCRHLLIYIVYHLNHPMVWETLGSKEVLMTTAACTITKYFLTLDLDPFEKDEHQKQLAVLTQVLALQKEFAEFVKPCDFQCVNFRKKLLKKYLHRFFANQGKDVEIKHVVYEEKKTASQQKWSYASVYRLSELLLIPRDELRGQLAITAASLANVETALKLAKELVEFNRDHATGEVLYVVAHKLCSLQADEKCSDVCAKIPNLAAQIHELASHATCLCSPDLLADCLELSKVTSKAYEVLRQCESGDYDVAVRRATNAAEDASDKDPYSDWTFEHYFEEDGLVMTSALATPMVYKYATACISNIPAEKSLPFTQSRIQGISRKDQIMKKKDEKDQICPIQKLSEESQKLMQYLRENSQSELALQYVIDTVGAALQHVMVQNMGYPIENQEINEVMSAESAQMMQILKLGNSFIKDLCSTLLRKIFSPSRVDHHLALGYMFVMPRPSATQRLQVITKSAGHNYKKVLQLARVGKDFAELGQDLKVYQMCKNVETNSDWGRRLGKLKISFKDMFQETDSQKASLLPQLVHNNAVNIDLIKEYCSDFNLDEDQAMFLYIEQLLVPSSDPVTGDYDRVSSKISRSDLKRVEAAIAAITKKDVLLDKLCGIVNKLDPYDYEKLCLVYKHINNIDPQDDNETALELLNHLTKYTRTSPVSDYEVNFRPVSNEDQLMYGRNVLSPLAKTRLPFHPFLKGDAWNIISPEVNADTVDVFVPIVNLLKLQLDQIYLTAIRNIITKYTATSGKASSAASVQDKSACNWRDEGAGVEVLDTVKKQLLMVQNIELAVACANWVIQTLPMGMEKVLALKSSVTLTQKWIEICPNDSEEKQKAMETFRLFSEIYKRLSTEQVLYKYKLGEPELVNLANSPARLIFRLYEHESIVARSGLTGSRLDALPDIHKVAEEIASKNKVHISKVRLTLVEKWLPSTLTNKLDDNDMTLNMTFDMNMLETTVRSEEEIDEDEINLKRVAYILQEGVLQNNVVFLLNFAYAKDSGKITNMCRVRALRCLFALVNNEAIARTCGKDVNEIKEYMQTLLYLVELDRLHIPHTVDSFIKCNKDGLVRGIWRNHSHEKRAVRLVADLCLDYEIYDVQLWNSILQQLMAFQLVDYLRHVLVCLAGVAELWQVDCIQRMWHSVLLQPLANAVCPLSEKQLDDCLQSVALLHRCPLLLDMNLVAFTQHLVRLDLLACAVGSLLYQPEDSCRTSKVQQLLADGNHIKVLTQLGKWVEEGRVVPMQAQILGAVYDYVNQCELYEDIFHTSFFRDFIVHLIQHDKMEKLVLAAISNNRIFQAHHLILQYRNACNEFADLVADGDYNELELLVEYLHYKGIFSEVEDYLPQQNSPQKAEAEENLSDLSDESHLSFCT